MKCVGNSVENFKFFERISNKCRMSIFQASSIKEGYLLYFSTNEDPSVLIAKEIFKRLNDHSFNVKVPFSMMTKKLVIAWNVDESLFKKSERDLAVEVTRCDHKISLSGVTKFHKGFPMKVEREEIGMSDRCLENGLLLYTLIYPPRMISAQRQPAWTPCMTNFCSRCDAYITITP